MKKATTSRTTTNQPPAWASAKVAKLLRLGDPAKNSNAAECQASYAKARNLMDQYSISPSDLGAEFRPYDFSRDYERAERKTQDETKDERQHAARKTVEDAIAALIAELKAGKIDRLLNLLDFSARFHKYSMSNEQIIASHADARGLEVQYVASFADWCKIGKERYGQPFLVRKGEQAIWIYAPIFKKDPTTEKEELVCFKLVPVFADYQIEQGEGQPPLDPFFTALAGTYEARTLYAYLKTVASRRGYTVIEEERPDQTRGGMSYSGKWIIVRRSMDSTSKAIALVHELAHAGLHKDTEMSKDLKECEAESSAYIVSRHFGIDDVFAAEYLRMYSNDEKNLLAQLDRIRKFAHQLIDEIEAVRRARGDVPVEAVAAAKTSFT